MKTKVVFDSEQFFKAVIRQGSQTKLAEAAKLNRRTIGKVIGGCPVGPAAASKILRIVPELSFSLIKD